VGMMSKKSPQLRFEGFTDDWEELKLGDIFSERSERSGEGELISVTINSGVIRASELNRTDNSSDDKSNYKKVEVGDIAYNSMRMWQGASGYSPYEGILSPAYTVIFPKEGIDSKFFSYDFKRYDMIQTFKRNSQGLTSDTWNLKFPTLKSVKVMVPCFEEQKQISNFFESVDKTIALHQHKLDLLKEQKKGYLQKMFPKNGEKIPELRFAGFADDWGERKSKEIFKAKVRKGEPNLPVLSVTQTSGVVYRGEVGIDIKYDVSTLKNYKVIEPNDFVISLRSFQGGFELSDKLGITSPAYTIFVPKYPEEQNNLFWRIQFKRFQFIESLKTVTFGIRDGKSISFNEFGDLKIKFPSNILEQQKIGTFFKQLDDTIALHQRKLDLLKEQKKGFLQKMFV
jgi:type I restriction enzyme S subunit